ncbi:hypothetical protein C7B70_17280 [Chlorogloea sp. CCALA 695]|nr:hypothetical protein C7B70_17280 [Chlorogloea sp. CCALA 695]
MIDKINSIMKQKPICINGLLLQSLKKLSYGYRIYFIPILDEACNGIKFGAMRELKNRDNIF